MRQAKNRNPGKINRNFGKEVSALTAQDIFMIALPPSLGA